MGFLDNFVSGKKEPSAGQEGAVIPDKPVPFGYKTSWLCVKSDSPKDVIGALGLENPVPSGWEKGIGSGVFVSPVLDGYVLVINYGDDIITENRGELDRIGACFPEVQYFSSHRVVEYAAWVKYVNGKMIRGYCWCGDMGEILLNEGEITAEEKALGLDGLLQSADDDWETAEFADEEHVLQMAAAWGIDTSFSRKQYPESAGWTCGRA
ncbi:MAG: hypothetical protein K2O14_03570 [Oscillospiraceae bacterium]|nr:hypothetical protein [Oscillospiraceae bacterium]